MGTSILLLVSLKCILKSQSDILYTVTSTKLKILLLWCLSLLRNNSSSSSWLKLTISTNTIFMIHIKLHLYISRFIYKTHNNCFLKKFFTYKFNSILVLRDFTSHLLSPSCTHQMSFHFWMKTSIFNIRNWVSYFDWLRPYKCIVWLKHKY